MNSRLFTMTIPAVLAASLWGCSSAPYEDETGSATSALDTDTVQHIAADLAVNLMRLAAVQGNAAYPCYANTILASQRYDISNGKLIFRTMDPLLNRTNSAAPGADKKCVTDQMRALLDLAQQDSDVAKFLTGGLTTAKTTTNGQYFASVDAIEALGKYVFPTNSQKQPQDQTFTVTDYSAIGSHQVTVSWVPYGTTGASKVVLKDTSLKTYLEYSPFRQRDITLPTSNINDFQKWLVAWDGLGYAGTTQANQHPYTPFAGASGNPYLVISYNNSSQTYWSNYFTTMSTVWCGNGCTGYLEMDPAPYAEPAAYYSVNNGQQILMGTQANPFPIVGTIWAADTHKCDWAQQASVLGRFVTQRVSNLTSPPTVQYGFKAASSIPAGTCP